MPAVLEEAAKGDAVSAEESTFAEQVADHKQLVHLGIGLFGFPFRNGLTRDAKQHGQSFLGQVALRT